MPKPQKPYDRLPLDAHATGQWCKKIDGRIVYFGTDWRAALKRYNATADGRPTASSAASTSMLNPAGFCKPPAKSPTSTLRTSNGLWQASPFSSAPRH